jgi:hypothetical protein
MVGEIVQAVVAGTQPFIATALVASSGNSYVPVAALMMFLAAGTLAALLAAQPQPRSVIPPPRETWPAVFLVCISACRRLPNSAKTA